ncbi:MAG: acetyl-CoA carboxylase biotin carboxyl carrier protein [Rhodospirillaceae bacterium]
MKAADVKVPTSKHLDSALVKQLASILDETSLTEIEYETGGIRVRVARQHVGIAPPPAFAAPAPAALPAPTAPAAAAAPVDPASHPGTVKSPMVGVCYLLPEPGAAPFVKVGDSISEGQTLCLIEAMKTFNPVKSQRAGKVTQIIVENGAPVEYGEPLLVIE